MPARPVFRDSVGVPLAANFALPLAGPADPGVPSAPDEYQLVNDPGNTGADPLIGNIIAQFRDGGSGPYKTAGTEWADRHVVEIRITGGINFTPALTGWQPLGADAVLELPELAPEEGLVFELRLNPPGDLADPTEEVALGVDPRTSTPAPGSGDAVGVGVLTGLHDPRLSYLARMVGDVVQNPGGADLDVEVQTLVWIGSGEIYSQHRQLVSHTAAGAADEKLVLVVAQDDGTLAVVDGPDETPPAVTEPSVPAGASPLALVRVDDSGVILDADITQRWVPELGLFALDTSPAFPSVGLSRGRALVDSAIVSKLLASTLNLETNQTNSVWLQRDGSFAVTTDTSQPAPRSLLLYELVTDGVSITTTRDRRELIGGILQELVFRWEGVLTTLNLRGALLASGRKARMLPLAGIVANVDEASTDATGGQVRFQIKVDDGAGGAVASILQSGEEEPTIAFDSATQRTTTAIPTTMTFPPLTRFEVDIQELPTGGIDPPDGATLVLQFLI
jgi:hypothetical protein